MFGFLKKLLGEKKEIAFTCYNCGDNNLESLRDGNGYRKKCGACGIVNYRVRIFEPGTYQYYLGKKEDREKEKEKWDIYYKEVYPIKQIQEKYGIKLYNEATNILSQRFGVEPHPSDIEWYCMNQMIAEYTIQDNLFDLSRLFIEMSQRVVDKSTSQAIGLLVQAIYYRGIEDKRKEVEYFLNGVKTEVPILTFDYVTKDDRDSWMFRHLEEKEISKEEVKKAFEKTFPYYNDDYGTTKLVFKNHIESVLSIIAQLLRYGSLDTNSLKRKLKITSVEANNIIKYLHERDFLDITEESLVEIEKENKELIGTEIERKGPDLSDMSDLVAKAVEVIKEHKKASAVLLQRTLGIKFAHSANIMDELEERGIVGPQDGATPRDIFI